MRVAKMQAKKKNSEKISLPSISPNLTTQRKTQKNIPTTLFGICVSQNISTSEANMRMPVLI